jgi:hypothetical protein
VLIIFSCINLGKATPERTTLHTITIIDAVLVLMMTILTTAGRGWMHSNNSGTGEFRVEFGLWNSCNCQQVYNLPCDRARSRLQGTETFSVISIFLAFVLFYQLLKGATCKFTLNLQRILSALTSSQRSLLCRCSSSMPRRSSADNSESPTPSVCTGRMELRSRRSFNTILFFLLVGQNVEPKKEVSTEPA